MNDFDADGIALGKMLGFEVDMWDEFQEKIEEMNLKIGLDIDGSWVVIDSENNVLAQLA